MASSIVDVYGKCGLVENVRKLFDDMLERNMVACNLMKNLFKMG